MNLIFENSKANASEKDGGFVFQAEISHKMTFYISDGFIVLDPRSSFPFNKNDLFATLHQVDLYPDLNTKSGTATLTYVILSEINILTRKFELAAEKIKQRINPYVIEGNDEGEEGRIPTEPNTDAGASQAAIEPAGLSQAADSQQRPTINPDDSGTSQTVTQTVVNPPLPPGPAEQPDGANQAPPAPSGKKVFYTEEYSEIQQRGAMTRKERKRLNDKYFKGTYFEVTLMTDHITLREISTNSLQGGSPSITLKLSTSLADEAFGEPIDNKEKFSIKVVGKINPDIKGRMVEVTELTLTGEDVIGKSSTIYDVVDKKEEKIFETILPSLLLTFQCDSLPVETFTNRSSEEAKNKEAFTDLFNIKKYKGGEENYGIDDETATDLEIGKDDIESKEEESKVEIIDNTQKIKELEKEIAKLEKRLGDAGYYKSERGKRAAGIKLDALKKELNNLKGISESIFVRQHLLIIEKRLEELQNDIF